MFFGYAFGPVVGFFTGAIGNTFGDALTGFGLFPQWRLALAWSDSLPAYPSFSG
jgi:uncharacterized membrane protein